MSDTATIPQTKVQVELDIPGAVDALMEKRIQIYPCHANRASSAGYECERRLVYERVAWEKKLKHEVGLQYIFSLGDTMETTVERELADAGIKLVEGQRPYKNERMQITGRIDGKTYITLVHMKKDGVDDAGNDKWVEDRREKRLVPIDYKSINTEYFNGIIPNNEQSVREHAVEHVRGYIAQIMVYMLEANEEYGVLLFKNKASGRYKQVVVKLDYVYAEGIYKKFERINAAVAAWIAADGPEAKNATLPARIEDLTKCKRCPFRAECLPDISFGQALIPASDPFLEQLISKKNHAYPARQEYEDVKEELDNLVKNRVMAENKGELREALIIVNGKWECQVKKHGKGWRVLTSRLGEGENEEAA